jgi:hypothetical protein
MYKEIRQAGKQWFRSIIHIASWFGANLNGVREAHQIMEERTRITIVG